MAESNDLEIIRSGMVNFLGAAIKNITLEGKSKNRIIVSLLVEEALKASQLKPNTPCELEILSPLFKANIIILQQQIHVLSLNPIKENKGKILKYQAIIEVYEELITSHNYPKASEGHT